LSFPWKNILGYPGQRYPIKSHHTSGFYLPENHLASSLLLPLLTLLLTISRFDRIVGGDDVREIDRKSKNHPNRLNGNRKKVSNLDFRFSTDYVIKGKTCYG
jgi:hypothetical protein